MCIRDRAGEGIGNLFDKTKAIAGDVVDKISENEMVFLSLAVRWV